MENYYFRNLVFEGGGVKGLAYAGALEVLEEKGILAKIQRVGGTSVGAIVALLVGLRYSPAEILDELEKMNLQHLMEHEMGSIRKIYRLFFGGYGWYKGTAFMKWLEGIIEKKTNNKNATFKEIKENPNFLDIYFQVSNLSEHTVETLSTENKQYENMPIKEAVRMSMSIPLVFKAVKKNGCYYVDGGVLSNYPIRLFDRKKYVTKASHYVIPERYQNMFQAEKDNPYVYNKETLGLRLESKEKIDVFSGKAKPKKYAIYSLFSYTWNLIATLMENQNITHLTDGDFQRTIYVDSLNVSPVDFNLEEEMKRKLVASGRVCTEAYFKEYDTERIVFQNRGFPRYHWSKMEKQER